MNNSGIDEEKLRAAKEKLACHIEPPKGSAYAKALAESGAVSAHESSSEAANGASGSCSSPAFDNNKTGDRIRLTEMTSAGG